MRRLECSRCLQFQQYGRFDHDIRPKETDSAPMKPDFNRGLAYHPKASLHKSNREGGFVHRLQKASSELGVDLIKSPYNLFGELGVIESSARPANCLVHRSSGKDSARKVIVQQHPLSSFPKSRI